MQAIKDIINVDDLPDIVESKQLSKDSIIGYYTYCFQKCGMFVHCSSLERFH